MGRELTPRENREIFVASDGEVFDYEDERQGIRPGGPEDRALGRRLDEESRRRWEAGAPAREAARKQAMAAEAARQPFDAKAARVAFARLGIEPTRCRINWWGDDLAYVYVPGYRSVKVTAADLA